MMISAHCCAADRQFDARNAERDLRRFRTRGPDPTTAQLVAAIHARVLPADPTLLDIGGGIGPIHHVLLDAGFRSAHEVDPSAAYLAAARLEAEDRGHLDRLTLVHSDFLAVSPAIPVATVVTLDRVVCCDPDYASLLAAAAAHATHIVALTYPRPSWLVRAVVAVANASRRLRGRSFREYVHPPARMSEVLERQGLRSVWHGGAGIWVAEVFERRT